MKCDKNISASVKLSVIGKRKRIEVLGTIMLYHVQQLILVT